MSMRLLRYNISSWDQAAECRSNNSEHLRIRISDYINDDGLYGKKIGVEHDKYGTLFAYMITRHGTIISDVPEAELTTEDILNQLLVFGFDITYEPQKHLPEAQLEYLKTLKGLGFDKIRVLDVVNKYLSKEYVVVFNVDSEIKYWIDNTYRCPESEFLKALEYGYAINISPISNTKDFKWDWLTYIANIDDILEENNYEV